MATALKSGQRRQKGTADKVRIVLLVAIAAAVAGGLTWWLVRGFGSRNDAAVRNLTPSTQNTQSIFEAPVVSSSSAPASPPEGMVYITGGSFLWDRLTRPT